jgi:hypothetical protein
MDIASYIMHLFGLFTLQLVPLLDEEGGKSQHYKLLKKRKIRSFFFTCKLNLLWQHVCVGHVVPTPNNKKNPKSLQAAQVVYRTSVGQLSTFGPILCISKEHIPKKYSRKDMYFKKQFN